MSVSQLKSPIVLVHGFCGFERFDVGGMPIAEYFPGIPAILQEAGNRVLIPWLSPTRGVAERAKELKSFLKQNAAEPVHLIAHSMGGLDARYMISQLDMGDSVSSLTTLGTPHRGTSFMDWGIRNFGGFVKPILEILGVPTQGFFDLTTDGCRKFNDEVQDDERVRYFSVAGDYRQQPFRAEWILSHSIVLATEGANDGVVSVASATYGDLISTEECDHLELAGWNNGFLAAGPITDKQTSIFARVLERLAAEGF